MSFDNFHRSSTKIDLASSNFFGSVPGALVRPKSLENLALQSNKSHGNLIEELKKLKNLKALKLLENIL